MALGSTQPLVKMSTRNISWGYRRPVREADNLTTYLCWMSRKSGSLNLLEPSGPHQACYVTPLPLPIIIIIIIIIIFTPIPKICAHVTLNILCKCKICPWYCSWYTNSSLKSYPLYHLDKFLATLPGEKVLNLGVTLPDRLYNVQSSYLHWCL
jgi:hypothetical protein